MLEYYQNLLNCRLEDIPVETFGHSFIQQTHALRRYVTCMGTPFQSVIDKCWQPISKICTNMPKAVKNNCSQVILKTKKIMENVDLAQVNMDLLIQNITMSLRGVPDIRSKYVSNFVQHEKCLESSRMTVSKCLSKAQQKCDSKPINVVQVIRMTMDMMEDLILAEQDIKVIYYTRDPRGIALSRTFPGEHKTYNEKIHHREQQILMLQNG